MAQTNVQAFSGDVAISSNLEVGTANLFVDTVSGRVGVGTTSPGEKLHVNGNLRLGSSSNNTVDDDIDREISTAGQLTIKSNDSGLNNNYVNLGLQAGNVNPGKILIGGGSTDEYKTITFHTSGSSTERMRIHHNGNVGIGTASPEAPFVVEHQVDTTSIYDQGIMKLTRGPNAVAEDKLWIGFSHGGSSADNNDRARIGTHIKPGGSGEIFFTTGTSSNQAERMRITGDGNVGIGTANAWSSFQISYNTLSSDDGWIYNNNPLPNNTVNVFGRACVPSLTSNSDLAGTIWLSSNDTESSGKGTSIAFASRQNDFGNGSPHITNARIAGVWTGGYSGALIFETQSGGSLYERMRISSLGKVGIGTASPQGLLHLSSGTSGDAHLIIEADTDNNNESDNPKIVFRQDGGFYTGELGLSNNHMVFRSKSTVPANTGFIFYSNVSDNNNSTTDLNDLENTDIEVMRITGTGNVGIGTASPVAKLHVNGAIVLESEDLGEDLYLSTVSDAANRSKTYIGFGPAGANTDWAYLRQIGGLNGNHIALDFHDDGDDAGFSIRDVQSTADPDTVTTRFMVQRGGNVGIGLASPAAKLQVDNGKAIFCSNQVQQNSARAYNADYSFVKEIGYLVTDSVSIDLGASSSAMGNYTATYRYQLRTDVSGGGAAFKISTVSGPSGTYGGYGTVTDRMTINSGGNVGIGTNYPYYPLGFTSNAGMRVVVGVVNPSSTTGASSFNMGSLWVGDNVVMECIAIYNPTATESYTFRCGYVQWIQCKVRGQGTQEGIQIIKSFSDDSSGVTVVGASNATADTVINVTGGVANISYTCKVFYRAIGF